LTETIILGTLAIRTGLEVEYDAETMSFNHPELNPFITETVRRGWEMGGEMWKT
jgi:hypothetical protein